MSDTTITVQTIIDDSITRAKDGYKSYYPDDELLKYINKAVDYIHKLLIKIKSELVVSEDTVTMSEATQEYSLADNLADFWGMVENGVYFASVGVPLEPVTYEDKIREAVTTTDTNPLMYYVTDTDIGVLNIPTATSAAAYTTLKCRYYKKNTTLTLTSSMPHKNLFNEAISSFVDHLAVMGQTVSAQELTALYSTLEAETLDIAYKRTPI